MTINGWRGFLLWLVVFAALIGVFMLIDSNARRACERHGGHVARSADNDVCVAPDGRVVSW